MRILKNSANLVTCAVQFWSSDNASTIGAALAFYCAFSLAPLLVIISTIAGLVIGSTAAYGQIGYQLDALFGPATAKILHGAVESSQQVHGLIAAGVSAATLVVSATTVLAALESVGIPYMIVGSLASNSRVRRREFRGPPSSTQWRRGTGDFRGMIRNESDHREAVKRRREERPRGRSAFNSKKRPKPMRHFTRAASSRVDGVR